MDRIKLRHIDLINNVISDINEGNCNLTEKQIQQIDSPHVRKILVGLLVMKEDLDYQQELLHVKNTELEESNWKLQEEKAALEKSKISLEYGQERLNEAVEHIITLANGDFTSRLETSDNEDVFDGLAVGLNMLSEELASNVILSKYMADLLNGIDAILVVIDNSGNEMLVNNKAKEIIGQHKGQSFTLLLTDTEARDKLWTAIEQKISIHNFEAQLECINGSNIPISISITPIEGKEEFIILATDISTQKQQQKLQNQLSHKLKANNTELEEMFHFISHDLKGPVRSVSMLVDWLLRNIEVEKKDEPQITALQRRIVKLYRYIDNIFIYSQINESSIEQTIVNVEQIARDCFNTLKMPDNGVVLEIANRLSMVKASQNHMQYLFYNLIDNAVKYGNAGENIVKIDCVELDRYYQYTISNVGPGISLRHYETVFKPFKTLDNDPDRLNVGMGLGIAKKIVGLYGGQIWIDSTYAKGAAFCFTLQK